MKTEKKNICNSLQKEIYYTVEHECDKYLVVLHHNWANSFVLNGELIEYQLVENGDKVYSGIATVVERRLDAASKFCQNVWERGEKGGIVEEGYAQLN